MAKNNKNATVVATETTGNNEQPNTSTALVLVETPTQEKTIAVKSTKDILEKSKNIGKCIERLSQLDTAAKELDSFSLGNSRMKDTLQIEDGNGNTFETSNVYLIDKVVGMLKVEIDNRYNEIETELHQLEAA